VPKKKKAPSKPKCKSIHASLPSHCLKSGF
jgi:hypothetical protein